MLPSLPASEQQISHIAAAVSENNVHSAFRNLDNLQVNSRVERTSRRLTDTPKIPLRAGTGEMETQIHSVSKLPVIRVVHVEADNDSRDEEYFCPECQRTFSTEVYDKTHLAPNCKQPFRCSICSKTMALHCSLPKHMKLHDAAGFKCTQCEKVLLTKLSHFRHVKYMHGSPELHKCDTCGKAYGHPSSLRNHLMTHSNEKSHKCETCGKTFRTPQNLLHHSYSHTGETSKCEICGKLVAKCSYPRHVLTHSPQHICDVCGKRFPTRYVMEIHYKTHFSKIVYVCEICGKSFSSRSNFSVHKSTHKEKNSPEVHPCEVCGKIFKTRLTLYQHRNIHMEKRFMCDTCGFKCNRRDNLATHILSHTGEKPFECSVCKKAFARQDNLLKHKRQVHGVDVPSQCPPRSHLNK